MTRALDATHDPALRSWVASANAPQGDFPIQNLPFAIFRRARSDEEFRAGVAIGDQIIDLREVHRRRLLARVADTTLLACCEPTLNRFMAAGSAMAGPLRTALSAALREDSPAADLMQTTLVARAEAEYAPAAQIGDYTDFYTSIHHARTVGAQFRPEQPLLPNYQWIPIAYHGRSSSIGISPQQFSRPAGQRRAQGESIPILAPTRRLDFELELGIFIGRGNALGQPIAIDEAESHVFGLCLLNDWSARDLQGWEYQPLGPFLGKNFATTISPWVVTLEALVPFRLPFSRPIGDPQPLPYLDAETNRAGGVLDIELEVALQTAGMRARGVPAQVIVRSNARHAYWTIAQMLAHHTVNGCNLRPGDLLGTGTLSGPDPGAAGSLLELTDGGRRALAIDGTETRGFLEDGDRVELRAWCEREGRARIGFGTATGTVLAAHPSAHRPVHPL